MLKEKNRVTSKCRGDNLGDPYKRQYVKPVVQTFRLDKVVQGTGSGKDFGSDRGATGGR